MELTLELLVQITLIIVLIIQVGYLARQTNFFRRSSQANLTEIWRKEFVGMDFKRLYPDDPNALPDKNEFQKLVDGLNKMHFYFREKLLKPSDFAIMFVVLYDATNNEDFRKTETYYENYLQMQSIFNDFNKDVDAVMHFFTLPTTSEYEKLFSEIPLFQKYDKLKKDAIENVSYLYTGFRIRIWWDIHIKGKATFPLKQPLYQPKENK